jgi:hypothetical protein
MENLFLILCYLVVSLILIVVGVVNWVRTRQFVETAQRTTGTVIAFVPRQGRRGPTYSPTVRFKAIDGSVIEFTESLSTRPPGYEIDEEVTVLYDPQDNRRARVFKSTWRLYYYALLFGGLGIIFFVVYLIVLLTLNAARF